MTGTELPTCPMPGVTKLTVGAGLTVMLAPDKANVAGEFCVLVIEIPHKIGELFANALEIGK